MGAHTLKQRERLGAEEVCRRAEEFSALAELLRERLQGLGNGGEVHIDKAPRLLALLGQQGANSAALLQALEAAVVQFDELAIPGWAEVRRRLAAERREQFLPVLSELVIARWALASGFAVEEFEPPGSTGRRADLVLRIGRRSLVVEVATPMAPEADWTERANPRLRAGLERIDSGLVLEVRGYDPLRFEPDGEWGAPARPIGIGEINALIARAGRAAAGLRGVSLPAELISPETDQPVRITAVARVPGFRGTEVRMWSSRSGLVPNTGRLCEIIRRECRQVPVDAPAAVLVDLSCWPDFRGDGYYLGVAADDLQKRSVRPYIGSFDWDASQLLPIDRRQLAGGSFDSHLRAAVSHAWLGSARRRSL